jgi:prolyl-tRNA synthetase
MRTNVAAYSGDVPPAMKVFDSPNTPTIDSLVELLNARHGGGFQGSDTLKNVLLMADGKAISILVPGDREVDLKRVEANLPGVEELRLFDDADFVKFPGLVKGYVGPQDAKAQGITVYADPRIVKGSHWITGANIREKHVLYVTHGRDFEVDGFIEAAEVRAGDLCPECSTPVVIDRAIEIGHIFQLGRKYAEALDLTVLDKDGKSRVVTMGSYGVGVSRAVAAIAEQNHDEIGLIWPREVAPADIHIVATGKDDLPFETAEKLASELEAKGIRVMLDDRRDASPGVKFKDAELIGNPYILIVGKGLAEGKLELRNRASGDKSEIGTANAVDAIISAIN